MKKRKIIIIEAPDRLGKDTLLKYLANRDPNEKCYKVFFKDDVKPPPYRNIEKFNLWLKNYLKVEMMKLTSIDNNIIIARLFTSDYVYSNIFDRQSYANNVYEFLTNEGFEFIQLTFIYKCYNDYLKRCSISNSVVEYSEEEFNEIQHLYINSIYNKAMHTLIERTDTINHEIVHSTIQSLIYS